jgi:exopolyphosphatase/guanosine-5'-triphosphate,3'-diphosphate pyrophosphatase
MDIGGGSVGLSSPTGATIFRQALVGTQRLLDEIFPNPEGVMPAGSHQTTVPVAVLARSPR